jgi:hypothetical protein
MGGIRVVATSSPRISAVRASAIVAAKAATHKSALSRMKAANYKAAVMVTE